MALKVRRKRVEEKKKIDEEEIKEAVEKHKAEKVAEEENTMEFDESELPSITLPQPHGEIEQYYLEALYNAHAIKMGKAVDYNSGRVKRTDYYLYGDKSIINEIWKKILRLVSLYDVEEDEPIHESIEDNLLDLMNYCADLYSYRRWKENLSPEEAETDEEQA